jgi:hypothetical protein
MKIYRGRQSSEGVVVTADNQPFAMNQLWNDSQSTQYSWGDSSVESEQLALSLLADSTDETGALFFAKDFSGEVLIKLNDYWEITSTDIIEWCDYKSEIRGSIEESDWDSPIDLGTCPRIPKLLDPNYRMTTNAI